VTSEHGTSIQTANDLWLSTALRSIGEAVIACDADGDVVFMNGVAEKLTGWTQDEAWQRPLGEIVRLIDEETQSPTDRVPQSETVARTANYTLLVRRDGMAIPIDDSSAPIRNSDGQLTGIVLIFRDITERRRDERHRESLMRDAEESLRLLRRQSSELETIYKTAPIGLALFDPVEFRYLRLNDTQAKIVGLPAEEILGKTLTEIAPIDGLKEMFEQVAQGKPLRNAQLEGELPTQPGVQRYWTVNYFPVYGEDGKVQAITAASLEVTAQKRAERALIQNEKIAAVGRLASSIAHEINNPLEAVTNLLYLAGHTADLQQIRDYLDTADRELRRISLIASQTLRFYRQSTRPQAIQCKALVESVLTLNQGRLMNSGIKVEMRPWAEQPIICFEGEIRQVLNNLVGNAVDAMPRGGLLLIRSRRTTNWNSGEQGVTLTFADTGSGISRAVQRRIFEPFFTTKDNHGTGLGLWISQEIVEKHQGKLGVRSSQRPGKSGTVFRLFLPFDAVLPDSIQLPSASGQPQA